MDSAAQSWLTPWAAAKRNNSFPVRSQAQGRAHCKAAEYDENADQHVSHIVTRDALTRLRRILHDPSIVFTHLSIVVHSGDHNFRHREGYTVVAWARIELTISGAPGLRAS